MREGLCSHIEVCLSKSLQRCRGLGRGHMPGKWLIVLLLLMSRMSVAGEGMISPHPSSCWGVKAAGADQGCWIFQRRMGRGYVEIDPSVSLSVIEKTTTADIHVGAYYLHPLLETKKVLHYVGGGLKPKISYSSVEVNGETETNIDIGTRVRALLGAEYFFHERWSAGVWIMYSFTTKIKITPETSAFLKFHFGTRSEGHTSSVRSRFSTSLATIHGGFITWLKQEGWIEKKDEARPRMRIFSRHSKMIKLEGSPEVGLDIFGYDSSVGRWEKLCTIGSEADLVNAKNIIKGL